MLIGRFLYCGVLLLVGCDQPDQQQLAAILADVAVMPQPRIFEQQQNLPATVNVSVAESLRDPFQWAGTLTVEQKATRVREALELHALESLSLVGVMSDGNNGLALVKSNQGLHSIQSGQHIGLYEGVVVAILADRIEIQEPETEVRQSLHQSLIMRASK